MPLVCLFVISIFDTVEWALFIAAFASNKKLNDEWNANRYARQPPFETQIRWRNIDGVLALCLLPLTCDTFSLIVTFGWAHHNGMNVVFVLCASVLAFPM